MISKAPGARCDECPLRTEPFVPPVGHPDPDLIVIGEGPGQQEVNMGRPFAGKSGQLLGDVLQEVGFEGKVHLTNAVLCRPPQNRKPEPLEIACCNERLVQELLVIRSDAPVMVVGNAAAEATGSHTAVSNNRGGWYRWQGRWVLPTWHPAYILREPNAARDFIRDVKKATQPRVIPPVSVDEPPAVIVIDSMEMLIDCLGSREGEWFAFDFESNQVNWVRNAALMLGIAFDTEKAYIITDDMLYDMPGCVEFLNGFFTRNRPIGHNGKFDLMFCRRLGISAGWVAFDTLLAHYALDERPVGVHGLKKLAREYFDIRDYDHELVHRYLKSRNDEWSKVPFESLAQYLALDVCITYALKWELEKELIEFGMLERPFYTPIMKAHELAVEMEWAGMSVDIPHLEYWREALEGEANYYEQLLKDISGHSDLNPRSAQQLAVIIWDERQMKRPPVQTWDKIKGQVNVNPRSTSEVALFHLARVKNGEVEGFDDPFLDTLFKYRRVKKILSTYVERILENVDENGRYHDDIKVFGTETGRLATFLHTIPRETTDIYGRIVRSAFKAPEGKMFVRVDFSQAELRSAGAVSQDPFIIKVYAEGRDLHTEVCVAVFGPDWGKEQRIIIKRYNFAYIYGGGYSALVSDTNIPKDKAHQIMADYDAHMAGLSAWKRSSQKSMIESGYVVTPFGRRRRFPYMNDVNKKEALKAAVNVPIQSSAADITTLSAHHAALHEGYTVILTKHDEVIAEVPIENAEWHAQHIARIMEETATKYLPEVTWKADPELSPRWTELPNLSSSEVAAILQRAGIPSLSTSISVTS